MTSAEPPASPEATFARIADLPVKVEGYELEGLEYQAPVGDFERLSTVFRLRGADQEGIGEDVTYDALDHIALQGEGPTLPIAGEHTMASFCELVGSLDTFPSPPERDVSRSYRRWAIESAALDLALRQAGQSLHGALDLEPSPVTFVCSLRLVPFGSEEASTADPVLERLAAHPGLRFKLDPTNDWTDGLIAELVATDSVDSLDLKGQYSGTPVDVETDPELYSRLIAAFPNAWLEDPDVNDETRAILDAVADRVTWDAPIHSIADIEAAPWKPRMVNIKPSRFGSLRELFDAYDYCRREGIDAYGGGQWELGPGRGQIQYLASLFHPDSPNDTAPSGYNTDWQDTALPASPLAPEPAAIGFRWGG